MRDIVKLIIFALVAFLVASAIGAISSLEFYDPVPDGPGGNVVESDDPTPDDPTPDDPTPDDPTPDDPTPDDPTPDDPTPDDPTPAVPVEGVELEKNILF